MLSRYIQTAKIMRSVLAAQIASSSALQTILASLYLSALARIEITFLPPVPITLSTFALACIGLTLPPRAALNSVLLYYAYAAIGLPVLAKGGVFMDCITFKAASSGYLFPGYMLMVLILSLYKKHFPNHSITLGLFLGHLGVYLPGLWILKKFLPTWETTFVCGYTKTFPTEFIKYTFAAWLCNKNQK